MAMFFFSKSGRSYRAKHKSGLKARYLMSFGGNYKGGRFTKSRRGKMGLKLL